MFSPPSRCRRTTPWECLPKKTVQIGGFLKWLNSVVTWHARTHAGDQDHHWQGPVMYVHTRTRRDGNGPAPYGLPPPPPTPTAKPPTPISSSEKDQIRQTPNSHLVIRQRSDHVTWTHTLQNAEQAFLRAPKVIETKQSLKTCRSPKTGKDGRWREAMWYSDGLLEQKNDVRRKTKDIWICMDLHYGNVPTEVH